MLRGLYTAASGMYAQQRKTDIITNNMANIHTPGFKEDQTTIRAFPEMLLKRMGTTSNGASVESNPIGTLNTGVYVQEILPRLIQGDLEQTERLTDLALTDSGTGTSFFTVQAGDDVKYTRNGSLTLDPQGLLTTGQGWPLLDVNGEVIRLTSDQFTVTSQGIIEENGNEVAQLGIIVAENPEALIKESDGLYKTENNEPLPLAENAAAYQISQGFIEKSTVDPMRAMTDLMTAYRAFEANQKILQAYDRSLDKTVNEVGRVNG
ncbi:flagellar hook-basal body protein [Pseudogracilibacillus auburnensis]|uniref:flagellar hook-basal body protein n=1 Tax=Pseudogracilibacillus auburnensis TaxID=1494959 RepID=UPI001A95E539|nr:flagellar hook-basal body protein [Pseudogracilibacillus auburnensis]MBO1004777.1 flagellar hook-basal body protein [Pseudogracilibacillus auburnensis]